MITFRFLNLSIVVAFAFHGLEAFPYTSIIPNLTTRVSTEASYRYCQEGKLQGESCDYEVSKAFTGSIYQLDEGSSNHLLHPKNVSSNMRIWLSNSNKYLGQSSLVYQVLPTNPASTNPQNRQLLNNGKWQDRDRIMHGVLSDQHARTYPLPVPATSGETSYLSFAVKFNDKIVKQKNEPLMIYQLWQGSPYSPPISVYVNESKNDGQYKFTFMVRRSADDNKSIENVVIGEFDVKQNQWNHVIIKIRPAYQSGGIVKVFLAQNSDVKIQNKNFRVAFEYRGKIGYNPNVAMNGSDYPNRFLSPSFGIYRALMPVKSTFIFNSIGFSDRSVYELLPDGFSTDH